MSFMEKGFMGQQKSSIIRRIFMVLPFFGLIVLLSACSATASNPTTPPIEPIFPTEILNTLAPTPTVTIIPSPTILFTPTTSPSPTSDTRPIPYYWRDWPVTPVLSFRARDILSLAQKNPALDLHAFSKVGDCQFTPATFLGGFVDGVYAIPSGYADTVTWFSGSMTAESVTAANGLGISSVLDPLFGLAKGNTQCQANETPLDCELRIHRPVVVLIAMGTNWAPHAEISFEEYLRLVVERVLASGALPILASKADNIEGDWKLDLAIAQVAYDYDLPLVNVWRSVQDLPNHGLEIAKPEYLTGDGWMRRNYAWLKTLEQVRLFLINK
jgi:hypothetical protein